MSKGVIVTLGIVGIFVLIGAVIFGSYVSAYNYGADMETRLEAEMKNNEQILANYGKKIKEAAQIPSMQTDDLVKIFTGTLGARYGSDGSKAAFQWIKEQNPQLDQSTYRNLQNLIEGGRNKFENSQTKLIDIKRQYKKALRTFWQGMWLRVAGLPSIDLDKIVVVTSERAVNAFETGREEALQIR